MGLLDDIRTHLINGGVVAAPWKCFIGYTPPEAGDEVLSLNPTGGFPQDTLGNENTVETFQVRVRAGRLAYTACENKWRDVFSALQDADVSVSGAGIYLLQALASGPLHYVDEKQRPNMTANFRVIRAKP